jgi:hypothetical protein
VGKSAQTLVFGYDVRASIGLNKPRTVPTCRAELGNPRAKRSRKVPDRPPDKKRSPASAATERRANRIESGSPAFSTRSQSVRQQPSRTLTITEGQKTIGQIETEGCEFVAYTAPAHRLLGRFVSMKAAADALSAARGGANA